jgi:hypothetical protein
LLRGWEAGGGEDISTFTTGYELGTMTEYTR